MNKADLIAAIAAKTGDTKKVAEAFVNAFVDVVTEALVEGEKVQLVGFGSFEVRKRAEKVEILKLKKKLRFQHQKLQYSKLVKH